jgi:hypothetical protein
MGSPLAVLARAALPGALALFFLSSAALAEAPAKGADPAAAPAPAATPGGEKFRCAADIYYSWKRLPPEQPPQRPTARSIPVPTLPIDEEYIKPAEVFFEKISQDDLSEEAAKKSLEAAKPGAITRAMNGCRAQHGEQARCVAEAMQSAEAEYKHFDFATRSAYLEGVKKDCERNTGICIGTRAGEAVCEKVKSPVPGPSAPSSPAAASEAEEAKGKKEEKKK